LKSIKLSYFITLTNTRTDLGKVEAYNKIVKNEFLAVEDISSIDDGKLRSARMTITNSHALIYYLLDPYSPTSYK
jgi:hypothetical protein